MELVQILIKLPFSNFFAFFLFLFEIFLKCMGIWIHSPAPNSVKLL